MRSDQEDINTTKKFSQEVHPLKSGMIPINSDDDQPAPLTATNKIVPYASSEFQQNDPLAAMILPDPGAHDNQVYTGLNHCYGWCYQCICFPLCVCCPSPPYVYKITEGHIGILTELGRFSSILKPGTHWINPCAYQVKEVDMRAQVFRIFSFFISLIF